MEFEYETMNDFEQNQIDKLEELVDTLLDNEIFNTSVNVNILFDGMPIEEHGGQLKKILESNLNRIINYDLTIKKEASQTLRDFVDYHMSFVRYKTPLFSDIKNEDFYLEWKKKFISNIAYSIFDDNESLPYLHYDYDILYNEDGDIDHNIELEDLNLDSLPCFIEVLECIDLLRLHFMLYELYYDESDEINAYKEKGALEIKGFQSDYVDIQLYNLFNELKEKYIDTTFENFKALLQNKSCVPIVWKFLNPKKSPHKTALREFVKVIFNQETVKQAFVTQYFIDKQGRKIKLAHNKKEGNSEVFTDLFVEILKRSNISTDLK